MAKTRKRAAPARHRPAVAQPPQGMNEELPAGLAGSRIDASADDLLAAMADRAIDQLFQQRQAEPPEPETSLSPAEEAALADADPPPMPELITSMPTDEELEALLRADNDSDDAAVLPVPAEDDSVVALSDELDADSLGQWRKPATPGFEADAIQADSALEARAGVNATEPPEAADASDEAPGDEPTAQATPAGTAAPAGLPWWATPLLWLNAPLAQVPQPARDAVGKVALVTLLNTTAVLVYCLIIRR